jgi:hypothetical protein
MAWQQKASEFAGRNENIRKKFIDKTRQLWFN